MRHGRQPLPAHARNAPSWDDQLEGWGAYSGGDFLDGLDDELESWAEGLEQVAPDGGPVDYDQFRSGLTFADVAMALEIEAQHKLRTTGERMFITRHTILGRWMQIKRESYAAYLDGFDR